MTTGLLAIFLTASLHAADPLRVETSRDLWISSYPKEQDGNNGGSPKLKLKGAQEFFLIDFDPTKFRGKRVVRATLHLHLEAAPSLGRTTVSTVAEDWVEGAGTGYAKIPGASSFAWARTDERRWGRTGKDLTAVTLGLAGTTWGFGDPTPPDANRWQAIPISPAVVQARIDGRSFGFLVMDDVGSEYTRDGDRFTYFLFPNRYVASKDSNRKTAPYFLLWLAEGPAAAATPPRPDPTLPVAKALPLPAAPSTPATAGADGLRATDALGLPLPGLRLYAAKGEAVTMLLESSPDSVAIDLPVRRFDLPKVGDHLDPLIVAPQGRLLEFQIPKSARAGEHQGTLRFGGRDVGFTVHIWNFTLPDRLSFVAQMNGYGLGDLSRDWFRLAHEHRLTLNVLPYGWSGRVTAAPKRRPDGSFDWAEWDARFGPLLDGSAFADLPRGPIPTESFYLPLNENWPMDHEKHFRGGYWIEDAYDAAYWTDFRAAAGGFATHFAQRGWKETTFEFYLNNKVYFKNGKDGKPGSWRTTTAPWVFDEPQHTQDFWALRRFGEEYGKATAPSAGVHMAFRLDISRPEWQRDLLDGVANVAVISGSLRDYPRRILGRARRDGQQVYMYGSASKLGQPLATNAAWCAETWALGADGVVPWQTLGKPDALTKPDDLALFYPSPGGPLPSLRLKSFRAGQQLVEYLTLYAASSGQDRDGIGAAVLNLPGLRAGTTRTSNDDAGSSAFGTEAAVSINDLRRRLGTWLDARAPADRERWHDPRPSAFDPKRLTDITPLPLPNGK
jgi:hypothetical protein